MRSDETTMLKPEFYFKDDSDGIRLFAYTSAICRKEGSALGSKANNRSGIPGLMKELEKTKLGTCDNA